MTKTRKPISAVVNARIESSRIERKMIRPYAGTTLLDIALAKLNGLDFFDHRFLAAAEDEIKRMAAPYPNVKVLERRPEAVARGPHEPMVTFEHYTRLPTRHFMVINACAAFLSPETIRKAHDIFQATDHPSYIAGIPTREWIFDEAGNPVTHKNPDTLQNTTHVPLHYKVTHSFYIADRDRFVKTRGKLWDLKPGDPQIIEMPVEEAVDVDTELEFEFSQFMYEKKMGKRG